VAHTCNPSYSGGRDQRNAVPSQACQNSLKDLISKKPFTKRLEWLKVWALSSNSSTTKKKKGVHSMDRGEFVGLRTCTI
jgi:hypothetical protein